MPAVVQPVSGVDWKKEDNDVVFHFTTMTQSPAAVLPSFISLYKTTSFTSKEDMKRVIYSIYKERRERSSQRTKH